MELVLFRVKFHTSKGDQSMDIKAFNAQQAKRKMLQSVSEKHDQPTKIKVEKVLDS